MIMIVEFYLYLRSSILTFLLLMINDLEVGDELLGCSVPAKVSCMKKMRMKMVQVRVWKSRTKISLSQNSKKNFSFILVLLFFSAKLALSSDILFIDILTNLVKILVIICQNLWLGDTTNCTPSLQMLKGLWSGAKIAGFVVFLAKWKEKKKKVSEKENLEGCLKCENSGWGVVLF